MQPKTIPTKARAIPTHEKRALRVKEASAIYGISRSAIYVLMARGALKSVKVGGSRLVPVDAMEELIAGDSK